MSDEHEIRRKNLMKIQAKHRAESFFNWKIREQYPGMPDHEEYIKRILLGNVDAAIITRLKEVLLAEDFIEELAQRAKKEDFSAYATEQQECESKTISYYRYLVERIGNIMGTTLKEQQTSLTYHTTDSRFDENKHVQTNTLDMSIDLLSKHDNSVLTIKVNSEQIVLDAYEAEKLISFFQQHQEIVKRIAEEKNQRALDANAKDMENIRREWHEYRNS